MKVVFEKIENRAAHFWSSNLCDENEEIIGFKQIAFDTQNLNVTGNPFRLSVFCNNTTCENKKFSCELDLVDIFMDVRNGFIRQVDTEEEE